jgi:hypothetical protein
VDAGAGRNGRDHHRHEKAGQGSTLSYWSLSADLPDVYAVARADFPLLPGLAMREGLKLAVPTGWGLAYDVAPGLAVEAPYPSCHAAMAFIALYDHERALYLGTHDERAHFKTFTTSADSGGHRLKPVAENNAKSATRTETPSGPVRGADFALSQPFTSAAGKGIGWNCHYDFWKRL